MIALAFLAQLTLGDIVLKNEGVSQGQVQTLDCVGSAITCARIGSAGFIVVDAGVPFTPDGGSYGSVTSVSVVTANGVSGSVGTPTTTPAITLTLGAIAPASVAVVGTASASNLSGTNTGDQTKACAAGSALTTLAAGATSTCSAFSTFTPDGGVYGSFTGDGGFYGNSTFIPDGGTYGSFTDDGGVYGSVTSASVVTANGVSGSVATATTTPAITITLGAITPSSVVSAGAVSGSNLSGTNTGDQTKTCGAGSWVTTLATGTGSTCSSELFAGTVTSMSVVTANGVSGSVATATTTPAVTLSLGAITPTSVAASGTVTGSNLSGTHSGTSSGTNTGDQTIALTGGVTGSGTGSFAATVITNANLTGPVTSSGNATAIAANAITDTMIAGLTASKLSGVVPTSNLGTGTANSDTFLRGDGTWYSITATDPVVPPVFPARPAVLPLSPIPFGLPRAFGLPPCNPVRRSRCLTNPSGVHQ